MTHYQPPINDMQFLLNEVFSAHDCWVRWPEVADSADRETAAAILTEAARFMSEKIHPLNQAGDQEGCCLRDGVVTSPNGFKDVYQAYCEGGWNGLSGSPEVGGMGLPKSLVGCVDEMLQGASLAFGLAPMLTVGACLAINAHGSDDIKAKYLPAMTEGRWSGAMDLTEPHAGTDLGLIHTKATPNADGSYSITGNKIFITWGEHDLTENIIHLVLAKLPDAPAGSRGISMFLVPKVLVGDAGELAERNSVWCGALEEKMGIHGCATCVMNFDGAKGWLIGEAHKGLKAMFTMMNDERIAVGIQGLGVAELAYQQAASYARERRQGRSPEGAKSPDSEADSLLVHADVRRMLLTVRARNEAARAFIMYVSMQLDIERFSKDKVERAHASTLVALLTPVVKAFITDQAFDSTVLCQQVLGGHGYIREWGVEQLVRDVRIAQIYEGTNGIQAMDLLGRKVLGSDGAAVELWLDDMQSRIPLTPSNSSLLPFIQAFNEHGPALLRITQQLIEQSKQNPHEVGTKCVDYCQLIGLTASLFSWIIMLNACEDQDHPLHSKKWPVGQFFLHALWPESVTLLAKLASPIDVLGLSSEDF